MRLNEQFRRRVRIIGKPDDLNGWYIEIRDIETGEMIEHCFKAVITLIAGELNMVEITYHELDEETGYLLKRDGELVEKQVKLHFPEIDVTALERLQKDKHGHKA
jgi:hypothetical protein